jgi:parallel beta-helix repeat protein
MKTIKIRSSILALSVIMGMLLVCFGPAGSFRAQASTRAAITYVTTITVTSTTDPDTSDSRTCLTYSPCTLRRAVIQARSLSAAQKPVLIAFNIPTSDPGYNATLEIWKIQFSGISSVANAALRYLNGDITIDGSTQPNGRTSGPKIILVGPSTGQNDGIKLGETSTQNANILRGLGFQNLTTHVYVNSNSNIIEDNWFGLNDTGTLPYLRNDNPEDGSGSAGVALSDGVDNNTIQENVFLGFDGVAAALRGEDTVFQNNYIGTQYNGIISSKQTDPSLLCTTVDWLGGGGISMDGPRHIVQDNIIAGLRQEIFTSSSQPDAITVQSTCDNCLLQNNKIGLDAQNHEIGVCGQGIDISNTEKVTIKNNTLVDTYHAAIFINGAMSDANTLSGNVIRRSTPWILPDGAVKADDAILRYSGLPDSFEFFNPAEVTDINGTTVTGTAGAGNPCPNCIIELFLDDNDGINEALQSLGTTTANASGNWSFTLAVPLASGYGIRTTSTTAQYNTIPNMNAGTTVGLSMLYMRSYKIYLPLLRK